MSDSQSRQTLEWLQQIRDALAKGAIASQAVLSWLVEVGRFYSVYMNSCVRDQGLDPEHVAKEFNRIEQTVSEGRCEPGSALALVGVVEIRVRCVQRRIIGPLTIDPPPISTLRWETLEASSSEQPTQDLPTPPRTPRRGPRR